MLPVPSTYAVPINHLALLYLASSTLAKLVSSIFKIHPYYDQCLPALLNCGSNHAHLFPALRQQPLSRAWCLQPYCPLLSCLHSGPHRTYEVETCHCSSLNTQSLSITEKKKCLFSGWIDVFFFYGFFFNWGKTLTYFVQYVCPMLRKLDALINENCTVYYLLSIYWVPWHFSKNCKCFHG